MRSAIARLDEIPGIGRLRAQLILAEIGLDMTRFPTAGHLASWAKLCPRTIQSGARSRGGRTGKGNPYLKGLLGEAAAAAAKTDTFLGERYRRIVRRRGKLKALVAVARSILVIIWHLLADPAATFCDLGSGYYASRTDKDRKARNHIRQLEALGSPSPSPTPPDLHPKPRSRGRSPARVPAPARPAITGRCPLPRPSWRLFSGQCLAVPRSHPGR